jgi:putative transposase
MVRPAALRQAVGFVQAQFEVSARRACRIVGCPRSTWSYLARKPSSEGLVSRMKELAWQRPRFGYRRLHGLLRREGMVVNHKRVYRLYRLAGLSVRRKRRKRIAARARVALPSATRPNQRWSMDFVSDATGGGRRFRVWTIVDDFTRESLALVVDTSLSGGRIGRELQRLIDARGKPDLVVCDNGPEFTSKALDEWAYKASVAIHFIRPGKPVENAFIESFNGRFRDECLKMHWFSDLQDARRLIEAWRQDYNEVRPHSSLDGATPSEYAINFNHGLTLRVP